MIPTAAISERIFNVFIYFEGGKAREYGLRHYRRDGTEAEKLAYLATRVDEDAGIAARFPLPRAFTVGEWQALQRTGMNIGQFEAGFQQYRAAPAPVLDITMVDEGQPRTDAKTDLEPFWGDKVGQELPGEMQDWLIKYTKDDKFHFDQLINDDYFVAIKLLFNARHLASACKLLVSCIDTLAFIEFGDERNNFASWLDDYVDLAPVGVTSTELWEFRNSIVHMTNLSSRAVLAGKVSPIMPYIGSDELAELARSTEMKPFNFYGLIIALGAGIGRWAETYNTDRDKFLKFVERYDTLLSDSRLATFVAPTTAV